MFRAKAVLLGALLALGLVYGPMAEAHGDALPDGTVTELPATTPEGVLGYYTTDGGKAWIPIEEQKGVAERLVPSEGEGTPVGRTMAEFMEAHRMSPEAEAAIVHQVPPVPITVDGALYEPEQIHLFDGKQLGFTVSNDGRLYAFTSFAALEDFLQQERQLLPDSTGSEYSFYFQDAYYGGQYQQAFAPNTTVFSLSIYYMDNMISSMRISEYATNGCTLFEHDNLQGDYFAVPGNSDWENLAAQSWNDRASSLVIWPR